MDLASARAPVAAHLLVWSVWAASWIAASLWQKRAAKRPALATEIPYRVLFIVGFFALFLGLSDGDRAPPPLGPALAGLWILPTPLAWATVALTVAGFLFAWWARLHLGALWSSGVTRKDDHRIVDTGPYAIVRHPIYTGLLAGALGLALVGAAPMGLAGFALLALGIWLKARLEERFLSAELGVESYAAYRRRTPMLVPFFPA